MYSGGDDGILPEDNPDYTEELKFSKQTETKDSGKRSNFKSFFSLFIFYPLSQKERKKRK